MGQVTTASCTLKTRPLAHPSTWGRASPNAFVTRTRLPRQRGDPLDLRMMANVVGISGEFSQTHLWRAHGLQPHRVETVQISHDPRFVEQATATSSSLCRSPPRQPFVLSVDEKSQIRRSNHSLACQEKGRAGKMTTDYKAS